jgi:membrane-associated protease RseP (regulator of RpoE activity)
MAWYFLIFALVAAVAHWSRLLLAMSFVGRVLHELGHWLAAKALGIYAPIFSLSPFGEPCHAFLRAFGTEFRYSPRWVEGVYVCVVDRQMPPEMLAEIEEATGIPMPPQPVVPWWQQILVDAAGPLMNAIFASASFISAYCLLPDPGDLAVLPATCVSVLLLFAITNARAAIFELYPRRGSDGWKIICDFLHRHEQ